MTAGQRSLDHDDCGSEDRRGIDEQYVDDALRVAYEAFAKKFRIGFRNADDLIRLFRDAVDKTSCFSALVHGQFAGLLTFRTDSQEFYHLSTGALFTRFSPLRAIRMLFNLLLLTDGTKADEFVVDSLAVDPSSRGMGIGTALLRKAEERANSMGKRTMSLGVTATLVVRGWATGPRRRSFATGRCISLGDMRGGGRRVCTQWAGVASMLLPLQYGRVR